MMNTKRYHYDFHDAYDKNGHLRNELDCYYNPIEVWDDDGHEITFYVDSDGCGYFVETKDGTYDQCLGTAQYRLPWSASTLRKQLREQLDEKIADERRWQALQEQYAEEERKYRQEMEQMLQERREKR